MFSLLDWSFWFQCTRYIAVVFFAYFIPGSLILKKLQMPKLFRIPLAIVVGMVLFALQGYIFAYFNIRFAAWIYLLCCFVLWVFLKMKDNTSHETYKGDKVALFLIILGSLAQLTTIWFSGLTIHGKTSYCCGDPNDNFFYGTISREIMYKIPPEQPGMSGEEFKNYHYWSNIVVGETARVFHIPVYQLQFQYSTLFIPFLTGLLLMALCYTIGGSVGFCRWLLFFFYFGSDAIYWILLFLRSPSIFSMSSLEDGIGFLANYPRAMAVMTATASIVLLFTARKTKDTYLIILTGLLFAIAGGMKIYVGFFCYMGLFFLALYDVIKKRQITSGLVGFVTLLFLIPIYLLVNSAAGGLFFTGFWRAQNFVVQEALHLERFEMARVIYAADHKWLQVTVFNLGFTCLFIVAIFGSKLFALFNTKKSLSQINSGVHWFFVPSICISIFLGLFFNQTTGESNTFNFIVSAFIFISLYSALAVAYWLEKVKKRLFVILLTFFVVVCTVPRSLVRVYKNVHEVIDQRGMTLPIGVLEASKQIRLRTPTYAMILVDTRPFYFDYFGPVFSMLTDRPMFFSGEAFLHWFKAPENTIIQRKATRDAIVKNADILQVAALLRSNIIDYIVTAPEQTFASTTSASFLETWYENKDVRILKIHRELIPTTIYYQIVESTKASELQYKKLIAPYFIPYEKSR